MNEREARRIVRLRSDGDCEVRVQGVCLGRATNFQHRKNRSQGGQWSPSNGLDVCGTGTTGCHGWIHSHPKLSRDNGWTVVSSDNPAETQFRHWLHGWVVPDDKGDFHYWHGEAA